ncbi:MAG: glyoxalase superfamily protein [Pseudomonadota bacterium]
MTERDFREPRPSSIDALKAQAKRLRQALADEGDFISHSEALELLAKQLGFRDWNTLHASAGNRPTPLLLGARVSGLYLGQKFSGALVALETLSGGRHRVTIDFDEPVDVVTFESFSAFRTRVTAVIGEDGRSAEKTSNGRPQMEMAR